MRLTYIITLLLVVAGFIAADYLLPSKDEIAMMKVDGVGLIESRADYETQLMTGNLSPEIVFPLVRIYLENNELNRAISLLEAYLQKNPNDIRALDRISTLYQYAGRQEDYARVLEKMNTLRADPENLKKLSDIYNYNQDYAKQAEVLEQMLHSDPDKTANYTQLAFIYRQMNRNEDAAAVMKKLFERNPSAMNQEGMESWAIALSQLGRQDDAFAIASDWLRNQSASTQRSSVIRISNIFYASRRPDLSYIMLQPYRDLKDDPEITVALVRAELASGQEEGAYERMLGLYKEGKLPTTLSELFLDVAIKRKNIDLIQALTTADQVANLAEFRLIQLTEFYWDEKRTDLIGSLRTNVGPHRLTQLPALDAVFSLYLGEPKAKEKAEALLTSPQHPVYQTVALSKATLVMGMSDLSQKFLFSLRPYTEVQDPELGALTWLMLQHGLIDEGLQTFEGFRQTRPSLLVDLAWVKMATAAGLSRPVVLWLNAHEDDVITPALLRDIYFIANDHQHYDIALYAAKRLYWRTAEDSDQYLYATALINNGQQVEAFDNILELRENGYAVDPKLYSSLLYAVAPHNPKYQPELAKLLQEELKQPNLSEERQIAILEELVQYNAADDYKPMIKQKALAARTGPWYYLYADILRKDGKRSELRSLEKEIATGPGSTASDKRRFAYDSLAEGNKHDAAALFVQLSETAKPGDKDLEQLLYLWGTRPEEDKLDWMARRAVNAPADERTAWLKMLYASGGYRQILRLVENIPADKRGKTEEAVYFEALMVLGLGLEKNDLQHMIDATDDPKRLRTLRSAALANNYPDVADIALEKLLTITPNDTDLLRDQGINLFNRASYSKALETFKKYHAAGGTDFRTFYYAGECLNRTNRVNEALPYYQRALIGAKTAELQDVDSQMMVAKSLFHLGRLKEAQERVAQIVRQHPENKNIQADYVLMLITSKQYDAARTFFNQIPANTRVIPAAARSSAAPVRVQAAPMVDLTQPPPQTMTRSTVTPMAEHISNLVLPRKRVLNVRNTQLPNEIVIQFTGAVDDQPLMRELGKDMPPWLQLTSTSYDSIVLVADHGIRLNSDFAESKDTSTFTLSGILPQPKEISPEFLAKENREGTIRLELLHAQLDLETGHQGDARERLVALNQNYPNTPPVLAALSNVEWYMGHTANALDHANTALALSPGNEDARTLRDRIQDSRRGYVKADGEIQILDDDVQMIGQLSGEDRIDNQNVVGIVADNNYVMANGIRRAKDGHFEDKNAFRARQEVYWRHELDEGDEVKLAGLFNEKTLGASAEYLMRYFQGDIKLGADYHRANWDFVEGILDNANRDRLAYTQNIRIRPDIAPEFTIAYNRYNLEQESNVARSWTVTGIARLPLYYMDSDIDKHLFGEYGLDAEYRTATTRGTDPFGDPYLLYPLVTREVHYATIGWRQEIETAFIQPSYWEAFGGYAYDRFGGNGPYIGGRWIQQLDTSKEFQLRFSHSIGFKQSDADSTRIGGYLTWKFQ